MRGQQENVLGTGRMKEEIRKSLKLNAIITKEVTRNAIRDKSDVRQPSNTPHVIKAGQAS